MKDSYGQTHRLIKSQNMDLDRRKRRIRRVWYNFSDDLGAFLWLLVAAIASALTWLVFANGLQWLKGRIG